jgi:predicted RNA-binding protein with PIN domain
MPEDRLIIIDGYNVIHRAPELRPGEGRSLRESRQKLLNLLAWTIGGDANVRFLVVFDGAENMGREEKSGRVEVRFSRPPDKADDLIRRIVEEQMDRVERITVVTSDLEVARHARAMGADISIADLFLASVLGPVRQPEGKDVAEGEKPTTTLSKKEIEDWAEVFKRGKPKPNPDPHDGESEH